MSFAYTPINLTGTAGTSIGGGLITVGTLGVYPTVFDAIAASHNVLFVNSTSTETSNITVPSSGLYITILPNGALNMGTNRFTMNDTKIAMYGQGTLQYGYSVDNILFDGNVTSQLLVDGIKVSNTSTGFAYITDIPSAKFNGVSFEGNLNILADNGSYNGCRYLNGNLTIAGVADNTLIGTSVFDGILIIDSGNGTLISDGVVI